MQTDSPYHALSETYDAIRPGYPDALIDDILAQTALTIDAPLLEIGAGTGKATCSFLSRGFCVDAVELDAHMAARLERKLASARLNLFVSAFETWDAPRNDYGLIYCAQAFHWLDRHTKFQRCAQLLAPGGFLALFWYDPLPPADSAALRETERVKRSYFGPAQHTQMVSLDVREQEIQAAHEFTLVFEQQYNIILHNSAEQALMAMESTPAFTQAYQKLSCDAQRRFKQEFTKAVLENGGFLDAPMRYSLYLLKKK